ncbi:MAG: nicotinamide-nucleotide amidohydrolase family protein [Thermomicrobiales bacterium]|nr:nicotinamide-nucleotide amidohydrolase family protein [Thermomicrobiales bacterium]
MRLVLPELRLFDLLGGGGRGTVSTAESCTGGGVAQRITSVAGSSDYFLGGIVAYGNTAKHALLNVPQEILDSVGAVSSECALAMADGARRAFGSDWAVSTTGIAGPAGATERKPVGLVYIAVAGPNGAVSEERHFPGNRAAVTEAASEAALALLVQRMEMATQASS